MKNNKGVTIVELVVSMTLLVVIATFLFQMIISLKEIYNSSGIKTELLNKQAVISKMINEDFKNKGIEMALECGTTDNCLAFYFKDGTNKTLEFINKTDNTPAYFIYGDYKTELVEKSDFGAYSIETYTQLASSSNSGLTNDSILKLDIPIKHPLLGDQNFGINIVYQYNHLTTSITELSLEGNNSANGIWLAGSSNIIWYNTVEFVDPGYYYLDNNNNLVKATDSNDAVLVTRSNIVDNKMTITYQSRTDSAQSITRTVNFINTSYDYPYNGSYYVFSAPVSGNYKIETWGANGNSNSSYNGGTGAYSSGILTLNQNEKIYVYVGGTGSGDIGGYNGGGSITTNQSLQDGAPGGGATDIRLKDGNWDSIDGLRSRIMVAAGGAGASSSTCGTSVKNGGNGGTITSSSFTTSSACADGLWTLTLGASQDSGGILEVYDTTGAKTNTLIAGEFGKANFPSTYSGDIKSGGGGGYYGGASSGYGSPGTGGSSFVSGCEKCLAIESDGMISNSNIHFSGKIFTNIVMEDGSNITTSNPDTQNNGYAKITLSSITHNANDINNTKKVTLNIGGVPVSRNITNDVTTFDLSSYDLSSYTNVSCNNGVVPELNGINLNLSSITSDTNCYLNNSINSAVTNADTSLNNIVLLNDETSIQKTSYIENSKNIKLNLNGKKLIGKYVMLYVRDGSLEINGDGVIYSNPVAADANGAIKKWNYKGSNLVINGNKCNSTNLDEYESGTLIFGDTHAIATYDYGTEVGDDYSNLEINGGCFASTSAAAISTAERNNNKAIINDVIAYSENDNVIYNFGEGNLVINGGEYSSSGNMAAILNVSGNVDINNATVTSNYNADGDWHQVGIRNEGGTININNTIVTSSSAAIYNNSPGTINIKSGEYTGGQQFEIKVTILNNAGGNINICGGKINGAMDISQAYQSDTQTGYIKYKSTGISWINGSSPSYSGDSKYYIVDDTITCE